MTKTVDKLVGSLAERISEKIFAGEYPPGSPLRQEALAEEFAVSRTPIREALRQLEARGVIEHRPNQGATVPAPDARDSAGWAVSHQYGRGTEARASAVARAEEGHAADHHDHRRQAERADDA